MSTLAFVNGTAVLPDRVLEDATVVAEDGILTEVRQGGPRPPAAVDLRGALLLPGLVDTHSDGIERELHPRPNTSVHVDFAVASYEGRIRAAGVTTMYHGIGYQTDGRKERSLEQAYALESALLRRSASGDAMVDHRLLLRLDARDPAGLAALQEAVTRLAGGPEPLVSFEDHTPGQGQYADAEYYRIWLRESGGLTDAQATDRLAAVIANRDERISHRDVAMAWLSDQARAGRIRLLAHDPAFADEVAMRHEQGVAVAEFPTTLEAAEAARELGLPIVAGAPNVLRGRSHSGNVSATELVAAGLVDALASDYMPSTLLAAVLILADQGVATLPRAIGLVTAGGARVAALTDRGALVPGLRADLTVATVNGGWPSVRATVLADELRADARTDPLGASVLSATVPSAPVPGTAVPGAPVPDAPVPGAPVLDAPALGVTVPGASVLGASVLGVTVAGVTVAGGPA